MRLAAMLTAIASGVFVLGTLPAGADPTILGSRFEFREKPGFPISRKLKAIAVESLSPEVLAGDPSVDGATLQVIMSGVTPTSQAISLPSGERWRRSPSNPIYPAYKWTYRESLRLGFETPVSVLYIAIKGGKARFAVSMSGRYVPIDLAAPNPGTYAGLVFTIGNGGGSYCINFLGTAGGTVARNDVTGLKVAKPTAEGTCPSGTPVCGDGIVLAPFETCDAGDDAACPGLCGANGLPCLCPMCGDGVIDPGEACDRTALGSCTQGCSYTCQCTTCGNGIVEFPTEECESTPDGECTEGSCGLPGAPNQCRCPICGDGIVNLPAEQCDGADDSACVGTCNTDTCLCAVCGNGVKEPGEVCDGSDADACTQGGCLPDCTCSVCGNGVTEPPLEQCDGADDGACAGQCGADCLCP